MHIQNRRALVIFNFTIGALAALSTWIQFLSFGHSAWRLFATWVTLIAAIYYILNATITLLAKRRPVGAEFCPMLQGGLIMSGITLALIQIISYATDSYLPSAGGNAFLAGFILPVLMIMSWVMFSAKGTWRVYDPFYWLALPAIYFSAILVSGEFMPRTARFVFPYDFLNYPSIGVDTMLWWFAIFAAVILAVGYIFWLLDFGLSGKLSQYIVLPKIKVVIVEEEIEDDAPATPTTMPKDPAPTTPPKSTDKKPAAVPTMTSKNPAPATIPKDPAEKPVKLVTTGARNQPAEDKPLKLSDTIAEKPAADTLAKPPVRIIEKIELTPAEKPADNQSKEIVIKDGEKTVVPKLEPKKLEPVPPELPPVAPNVFDSTAAASAKTPPSA